MNLKFLIAAQLFMYARQQGPEDEPVDVPADEPGDVPDDVPADDEVEDPNGSALLRSLGVVSVVAHLVL